MRNRIIGILFALGGLSFGQNFNAKEILPLSTEALLLMPAEQACSGMVVDTKWSQNGKYLLVESVKLGLTSSNIEAVLAGNQSQFSGGVELSTYDTNSGEIRVIRKLPDVSPITVDWIGNSRVVLLGSSSNIETDGRIESSTTYSLLDVVTGAMKQIGSYPDGKGMQAVVSPGAPLVALIFKSDEAIQFVRADGFVFPAVKFPSPSGIPFWADKGKDFYFMTIERGPQHRIIRNTWKFIPGSEPVKLDVQVNEDQPTASATVAINQRIFTVSQSKTAAAAHLVWLVRKENADSLLVTSDGENPSLSPNENAVSYTSRGALVVRRIAHVPILAYKKIKADGEKAAAISNAKQAALALIMYAHDYDDVLPSNGSGWRDNVMPYIKSQQVINTFNYTYSGGLLTSLSNPAGFPIGYVDGPNGHAVAYADGHVVWVPNP